MFVNHSKPLSIHPNSIICSRGYKIARYTLEGKPIESLGSLPDPKYALLARCPLTRRFFRAEITGLYELKDGSRIAIAKKGLFLQKPKGSFEKVFTTPRGSKPLNLCILPNGHMFFGEYFQNMERKAVNIYASYDNGCSWQAAYTFAEGKINHIHKVTYDPFTGRIWVLTGDRENECIVGYTEDEFKSFKELFRGGQEYRSCHLFFYEKFIVFATDSQYMQNEIRCFDRDTLEIKSLAKIQGSAIKGGQVGSVSFLATTIEPSEVNKDRYSHLWYTKDGLNWADAVSYKKDSLPAIFQFGTIEFPNYECPITDKLWYSGRALKGLDGKSAYIEIG